jgi:hypothetical protein
MAEPPKRSNLETNEAFYSLSAREFTYCDQKYLEIANFFGLLRLEWPEAPQRNILE